MQFAATSPGSFAQQSLGVAELVGPGPRRAGVAMVWRYIAPVALALVGYAWTPGTYSKVAPLRTWNFTIPLPRTKVAKLLVQDFDKTAQLWLDEVISVRRVKQGHLVRTLDFDMVASFHKTSSHVYTETMACSELFLSNDERPSPEEIVSSPGVEWAAEWRLQAKSPTETEVTRIAYSFVQRSNRILPLHLLVPLGCRAEHARMRKNFVGLA